MWYCIVMLMFKSCSVVVSGFVVYLVLLNVVFLSMVVGLCSGCDGCCAFCDACRLWCSCSSRIFVSSSRCCVFVSCMHHVAVLSAALCVA